ncbi:MAG: hypothetical protein AAF655_17545 [Bacteroidota bacterium]
MENSTHQEDASHFDYLLREGYEFKLGEYINRGWELAKMNLWGFIGFILIAAIISGIANSIPKIGILVSLAVGGPLAVAPYIVSNKLAGGLRTSFEDFFEGFRDYKALTITYVLQMAFTFGPFFLLTFFLGDNFFIGAEPYMLGIVFLAMIPCMYLTLAFTFALPLVYFESLDPLQALGLSRKIITKKWWSFFLLMLVLGVIQVVGLFVLIVGVFVSFSVFYTSIYAAYEDIIGQGEDPLLHKIEEIGQEIESEDFDEKP